MKTTFEHVKLVPTSFAPREKKFMVVTTKTNMVVGPRLDKGQNAKGPPPMNPPGGSGQTDALKLAAKWEEFLSISQENTRKK